jgi:hypothetical protein
MDWSWDRAAKVLTGEAAAGANAEVLPRASNPFYRLSWGLLQVALPRVITFLVATALFLLGQCNHLTGFSLGSHAK